MRAFCKSCGDWTTHKVHDPNHERDSSQIIETCMTCKWFQIDGDGVYHEPIHEPVEEEEVVKPSKDQFVYRIAIVYSNDGERWAADSYRETTTERDQAFSTAIHAVAMRELWNWRAGGYTAKLKRTRIIPKWTREMKVPMRKLLAVIDEVAADGAVDVTSDLRKILNARAQIPNTEFP